LSVLSKILHVSFLCLEQIFDFAVFGFVKETNLNNHRILSGKKYVGHVYIRKTRAKITLERQFFLTMTCGLKNYFFDKKKFSINFSFKNHLLLITSLFYVYK